MPKFKVGDIVYAAHFDPLKGVTIPCSVCAGKKKVTLILGNGDHVELECSNCGKGYDAPTGVETVYEAICSPKMIRIDGMDISVTSDGTEVEYWVGSSNCHTVYKEDMVFDTLEEVMPKSEEKKAEWIKDQNTRAEWIKYDKNKNYAWNAGYHMREAKRHEKQAEYHREKAKICKSKVKEAP